MDDEAEIMLRAIKRSPANAGKLARRV